MDKLAAAFSMALVGVVSVATGSYSSDNPGGAGSLAKGIAQTQHSLDQIDELLGQNDTDLLKLLRQTSADIGTGIGETPLSDAVDVLQSASNGFNAATAFENQHYLQAIGHAAEVVASVWGQLNPAVAKGKTLVDLGADAFEAWALLGQQAQLLNTQFSLWQQLLVLQGKDPESLAKWESVLKGLYGDPQAEHQAFLKWLAANGLSEKDVVAKALANAATAGPAVASQVASGIRIVDPNEGLDRLSEIPNISPDFIAAMKRCNQIVSDLPRLLGESVAQTQADRSRCAAAGISATDCPQSALGLKAVLAYRAAEHATMTCNKYPDGSYIPAFGGNATPTAQEGGGVVSTSLAGGWNVLPGSYYTNWVSDPGMLQSARNDNHGGLGQFRHIAPGHFQIDLRPFNTYIPVDLHGSETRASGDGTKVIRDTQLACQSEISVHVDAWLSDGRLYWRERQKVTTKFDGTGSVQRQYAEVYSIGALAEPREDVLDNRGNIIGEIRHEAGGVEAIYGTSGKLLGAYNPLSHSAGLTGSREQVLDQALPNRDKGGEK